MIFDNSDHRMPTGRETVTLRRTISLQKDEFLLDGKPVTRMDVHNLLQSAGFSKFNPYYIVAQGRVTHLTNAKDSERLAVLKEVAGTSVYEQHRKDSEKIMNDTLNKKARIQDLLHFIHERLMELENERSELAQHQQLEQERKLIEFILYQREQKETSESLLQLESDHKGVIGDRQEQRNALGQQKNQLREQEEHLLELESKIEEIQNEFSLQESERTRIVKLQTKLHFEKNDLLDNHKTSNSNLIETQNLLDSIEEHIRSKEDQLANIIPQLSELQSQEINLRDQLQTLQTEKDATLAKRIRAEQFRSVADRDRWIRKEIEALKESRKLQHNQLLNIKDEIETGTIKEQDLREALTNPNHNSNQNGQMSLIKELESIRSTRDTATEKRKELFRQDARLQNSIKTTEDEFNRLERDLRIGLDRHVLMGIEGARLAAERLGLLDKYYGPIAELFSLRNPKSQTAVEIIAGSSLWHIVVSDDNVATQLIEQMQKDRLGRATFMPLNRLRPQISSIPIEEDCTSLMDELLFDPLFERAIRQVFGKALLVSDLTTGSRISRIHKMTAITHSGDRIDKKGALTGGFVDQTKSKLALIHQKHTLTLKIDELKVRKAECKALIASADQQVTNALTEMEKREYQLQQIRSGQSISHTLIEANRREYIIVKETLSLKQKELQSFQENITKLDKQVVLLESEIGTSLISMDKDKSILNNLQRDIETTRIALSKLMASNAQLSLQQESIESELDLNLRRKRLELQQQMANLLPAQEQLILLEEQIQERKKELSSIELSIKELVDSQRQLQDQIASLTISIENTRSLIESEERGEEYLDQAMDRYQTRKAILEKRNQDILEKIASLGGSLRIASSNNNLTLLSNSALLGKLQSFPKSHQYLNLKAFEQFDSFTRQGKMLQDRFKELEDSERAIRDFIQVLDQKKDEAIQRTFDQVSTQFTKIIERLVPTGYGILEIQRNINNMEPDRLEYSGVSIKVN